MRQVAWDAPSLVVAAGHFKAERGEKNGDNSSSVLTQSSKHDASERLAE